MASSLIWAPNNPAVTTKTIFLKTFCFSCFASTPGYSTSPVLQYTSKYSLFLWLWILGRYLYTRTLDYEPSHQRNDHVRVFATDILLDESQCAGKSIFGTHMELDLLNVLFRWPRVRYSGIFWRRAFLPSSTPAANAASMLFCPPFQTTPEYHFCFIHPMCHSNDSDGRTGLVVEYCFLCLSPPSSYCPLIFECSLLAFCGGRG